MKEKHIRFINYTFGAAALLISAALIWAYYQADDKTLAICLWPHAKATEAFYNINLSFVSQIGYLSPNGTFAIGRDCMGIYYIAMLFCMSAAMFVGWFSGFKKVLWFFASLIGAVLIGLFVSCIRIIGSVPFLAHEKFATLHTGIGAALYLLTLIACFYLLNKKIRRRLHENKE